MPSTFSRLAMGATALTTALHDVMKIGTFSTLTSRLMALMPICGSAWVSSTITSSFRPAMPPFSLISFTAMMAALPWSVPNKACEPVKGIAKPNRSGSFCAKADVATRTVPARTTPNPARLSERLMKLALISTSQCDFTFYVTRLARDFRWPLTWLEDVAVNHRWMAPCVRWRIVHLRPKEFGCPPRPSRVCQHAASQRDKVGLAVCENRFSKFGLVQQSDGHGRNAGLAANAIGKRYLISRTDRDLLLRRKSSRRDRDVVAAERFQLAHEFNTVGDVPPAVDPIGGGK